jgi:hypothetical protein
MSNLLEAERNRKLLAEHGRAPRKQKARLVA